MHGFMMLNQSSLNWKRTRFDWIVIIDFLANDNKKYTHPKSFDFDMYGDTFCYIRDKFPLRRQKGLAVAGMWSLLLQKQKGKCHFELESSDLEPVWIQPLERENVWHDKKLILLILLLKKNY